MFKWLYGCWWLVYSLCWSSHVCGQHTPKPPYVLLVSFDGFRHDYVEKYDLPFFKQFISEGVQAKALIPSFPSKTFPNHYTIITGMYPGNHGLVDNSFYDKKRGEIYKMSNRNQVEDPYWYGGTPLWQLAQRNGYKTASYYWVGSEAPLLGIYPTYYFRYDGAAPNEKRIDQVIDWWKLPESERPQLITLYFSLADETGHTYGPNSKQMQQTALRTDSLVGYLMKRLKEIDLPIDVILASDHGMVEMKKVMENFIPIEDYTDLSDSTIHVAQNAFDVHIYCDNQSKLDIIYRQLKAKATHYSVYKRAEILKEFHYNSHERIGDILITTEPPYMVGIGNWIKKPYFAATFGQHGSNPYTNSDLHGIFYARGVSFKQGLKIPAFQNIHIYPLIAHLLHLPIPPDIDGKLKVLQKTLQKNGK